MKKLSATFLFFVCFNLTNFIVAADEPLVMHNECQCKFALPSVNTKDGWHDHLTGAWKGIVNATWLATLTYLLLSPKPFAQDYVLYNTYILGLGGSILTNWSLGSCWPNSKEQVASLITGMITLLGLSTYAIHNNMLQETQPSLLQQFFSKCWQLLKLENGKTI